MTGGWLNEWIYRPMVDLSDLVSSLLLTGFISDYSHCSIMIGFYRPVNCAGPHHVFSAKLEK